MPSRKHSVAIATLAPAPPVRPLLVNVRAAAELLGTTVWQIRQLVWAKKLPVAKLGQRYLFRPADLEAFANKQAGA
jgi:excisionase family DNA binding protein